MSQDHNDIYSIVERLRVLEEGLDKNQRSVNQLSATFKPKTVAVLTAKKDPKNPMAGKLVGSDESVESDSPMLEAEMAEDVLEKVKNSFKDFIKQAEQSIDKEVQEKKSEDTDLKNKDKKDRDLIAKAAPVAEDPTQEEPPEPTMTSAPVTNPTYGESAPVKSLAINDSMICEIHGNERDGFEIRRGDRRLPTRFKNIEQAEMALEMFKARLQKADQSQDYLDEE
jgi:hypothetical protein